MRKDYHMDFTKQFGRRGRDVISGFTGIIMGVCTYYTGCNQVQLVLQDQEGKDRSRWFDDARIEVLEGEPIALFQTDEEKSNGGPIHDGLPPSCDG